jgi:hypothetical protein
MKSFSEWMNEQPGEAQPKPTAQPVQGTPSKKPVQKKWKATKDQIVQYWRNLRPDTPIQMSPIRYDHQGTTYAQDGVRITGSPEFIGSVLARLKEFLNFETPQTKLQLVYRETDSPSQAFENKTSFVFYVQTKARGSGQDKPDAPSLPKPKKVKPPVNPPTGVG